MDGSSLGPASNRKAVAYRQARDPRGESLAYPTAHTSLDTQRCSSCIYSTDGGCAVSFLKLQWEDGALTGQEGGTLGA